MKPPQFGSCLRQIIFLRHANPNHDLTAISPLGREQAGKCARKHCSPPFDLALRSPSPCTEDMAHIVAGFSKEKSIHLVPSLALSKGDPASDIIRSAFEESEFPITNLRMLFDKGKSVKHAVMERAEQSRKFIAETFENEQAQKALVIGHDILIQALCTQFFGDVNHFLDKTICECGGFILRFNEQGKIIGWEEA